VAALEEDNEVIRCAISELASTGKELGMLVKDLGVTTELHKKALTTHSGWLDRITQWIKGYGE
jgi:hypothetical protein